MTLEEEHEGLWSLRPHPTPHPTPSMQPLGILQQVSFAANQRSLVLLAALWHSTQIMNMHQHKPRGLPLTMYKLLLVACHMHLFDLQLFECKLQLCVHDAHASKIDTAVIVLIWG